MKTIVFVFLTASLSSTCGALSDSSIRFRMDEDKSKTSPDDGERQVKSDSPVGKLANIDYIGLGYDVIFGNPHSDLYDPGFKQPVIQLDYNTGSTTNDGKWYVPDRVQVLQTVSCSYEAEATQVSGTSSYRSTLSEDARVSGSFLWGAAKFSASFDYKEVWEGTSAYSRKYMASVARCISYRADINYKYAKFRVSDEFGDAVRSLPVVRDDPVYLDLISVYGTHFASTLYMGAKAIARSEFESTNWTRLNEVNVDVKVSARASFFVGHVDASSTTDYQRRQAESFDSERRSYKSTYLGSHPPADGKWQSWAAQASETPYPVQYSLVPLTDLLTERFFPDINRSVLAEKRRLLEATYDVYCASVNGCGVPGFDRGTTLTSRLNVSVRHTKHVTCRPGFSLLSCGIENSPASLGDYKRYSVPTSENSCECVADLEAVCVPWCSNVVSGFEIVRKSGSSLFNAACSAGKKVLGCHLELSDVKEHSGRFYPSDDGTTCLCSSQINADCVASCAANVTNYEIRSEFGHGDIVVACSPGNYVLGCGLDPEPGDDPLRSCSVATADACRCTDTKAGATCYAVCGRLG